MANEQIEPCPFCGEMCYATDSISLPRYHCWVACSACHYRSGVSHNKAEAISAHNTVSRAVAAVGEMRTATEALLWVLSCAYVGDERCGDMAFCEVYRDEVDTVRAALAKYPETLPESLGGIPLEPCEPIFTPAQLDDLKAKLTGERRYGGQWICPDCQAINLGNPTHCHGCHRPKPVEVAIGNDHYITTKKPRRPRKQC